MELSKKSIDNLLFYYGELSYIYYNSTDYLIKRQYGTLMNQVNDLLALPRIRRTFYDYLYLLDKLENENTNI